VRPELRGYIGDVPSYRESFAPGDEVLEHMLPDGASRLVFNLGEAPAVGAAPAARMEAVGASCAPVVVRLRGEVHGLSLTLRVGAARRASGRADGGDGPARGAVGSSRRRDAGAARGVGRRRSPRCSLAGAARAPHRPRGRVGVPGSAGRGVALELGAAGATVYVRGRSTRAVPATHYASIQRLSKRAVMPGNIDETAETVRERAGAAWPCAVTTPATTRCASCSNASIASRNGSTWWSTTPGAGTRRSARIRGAVLEQPLVNWDSMLDRGVR
jgi:hypothetical protein